MRVQDPPELCTFDKIRKAKMFWKVLTEFFSVLICIGIIVFILSGFQKNLPLMAASFLATCFCLGIFHHAINREQSLYHQLKRAGKNRDHA